MPDVAKCTYADCINKENCYRFNGSKGEIMEIQNICNESNNYDKLIKINKDIIVEEKKDE